MSYQLFIVHLLDLRDCSWGRSKLDRTGTLRVPLRFRWWRQSYSRHGCVPGILPKQTQLGAHLHGKLVGYRADGSRACCLAILMYATPFFENSWPLLMRNVADYACADAATCTYANNKGWRYEWYTCGAIVLAMSVLRVTVIRLHETPKYLLSTGRDAEVASSLKASFLVLHPSYF
jgi:hypothetical protein